MVLLLTDAAKPPTGDHASIRGRAMDESKEGEEKARLLPAERPHPAE
jgi:hypothetical protein